MTPLEEWAISGSSRNNVILEISRLDATLKHDIHFLIGPSFPVTHPVSKC